MPTTDTFQVPAPLPAIDLDVTIPHSPADLDDAPTVTWPPAESDTLVDAYMAEADAAVLARAAIEAATAAIGDMARGGDWAARLRSALHPARRYLHDVRDPQLVATARERTRRVQADARQRHHSLEAQDAWAAAADAATVVRAAAAVSAAVAAVEVVAAAGAATAAAYQAEGLAA